MAARNDLKKTHGRTEKRCSVCHLVKPLIEFYLSRDRRDGRQGTCKSCQIVRSTQWNKDHPETAKRSVRRVYLRKLYGLTPERYDELLIAQGGGCAICGRPDAHKGGIRLHVDHDHDTGKVRGLLCSRCNQSIGAFEDDPALLRLAVAYLERM